MSKRHVDRPKVAWVSEGAERLALVSCPHLDGACDNCRFECQREVARSQTRRVQREAGSETRT